jgi:molybdopterin-guanine dinucleotide biosynthesis protein A
VLAGGRSSRFGAEKMAADVEGQPLLHHAVRAAASVCDEVLVVGAPGGLPVDLPDGLAQVPVVVLDVERHEGPLIALVHAAGVATQDRVLLIAGDMPDLQPPILERVLTWGEGSDGACLMVDGWPQPFPMGLDRATAIASGTDLIASGERSLRRLMAVLSVERVPQEQWEILDPTGQSLRDVDRPEDIR